MASSEMAGEDIPATPTTTRNRRPAESGPFVLRSLLDEVPLSADGGKEDIRINCVDYLDANLYVGTSASELLHFFQIPADPEDNASRPAFILASRLRPAFSEPTGAPAGPKPGVQQILLLPKIGKACVLCNWTVTFYSLPELSPIFTQVRNCNWIGGVDLSDHNGSKTPSVTILLSLNRKIQVVKIGDDARRIKQIDFAGSTISIRRDSIACVADSKSYALLDVDHQLKIPLMTISSLEDANPADVIGQAQAIAGTSGSGITRSSSSAQSRPLLSTPDPHSHNRSTSLGGFISGTIRRQEPKAAEPDDSLFQEETPPTSQSAAVAQPIMEQIAGAQPAFGPIDAPAAGTSTPDNPTRQGTPKPVPAFLKPHIVSPTPEEFLLVTGTGPLDPGIGMFVNLDGDPTRPTIEFERYPKEIIVDGGVADLSSSKLGPEDGEEGYVLASMTKDFSDGPHQGLEIQRWDLNVGEGDPTKYWLEPLEGDSTTPPSTASLGVRSLVGTNETYFYELIDKLAQKKFSTQPRGPYEAAQEAQKAVPSGDERESRRNREEEEYAKGLAKIATRLAVWSGSRIWWAIRNPLLFQLESALHSGSSSQENTPRTLQERRELFTVLNSFRGRDAKSELEFLTFSYIRQKAGLLLFISFLHSSKQPFAEPELKLMEDALLEGSLDPRVVLASIPALRGEINESSNGIWIYGGVKATADSYVQSERFGRGSQTIGSLSPTVILFLRKFLAAWRKKKGFGSVADENEVFRTVDASYLAVLLELDKNSPKGVVVKAGSVRAELYELVDGGVDCFERAVALLESYHRLFVLSRLYQSRKMASNVLATWKRIIEGEQDVGGELTDGELRVREYLMKISSQPLVQEYGVWLANRNPKLGVKVFAEDKGRAPKFEPSQVVSFLRDRAPDAVKYYLEHLVFGKGHTQYVNELITYYLDVVVGELQSSQSSRDAVAATYETYRALHPPKPTYRHFLTDNAPADDDVWHSRLRLLQLLGGAHDYDAAAIRRRITEALPSPAANLDDEDDDDDGADEDKDGKGEGKGKGKDRSKEKGKGKGKTRAVAKPSKEPRKTPLPLLVPETIILDGRERKHEDALRLLVHGLGDYDTAVAYCLRGGSSIYAPLGVSDVFSPLPGTEALPQQQKQKQQQHPTRRESLPDRPSQARLFSALLGEFLQLEDPADRVEQTAALLDRFGAWFDVADVLVRIPDGWAVEVVAGFLVAALRNLLRERRDSDLARALSSAENVRVGFERAVKTQEGGGRLEPGN